MTRLFSNLLLGIVIGALTTELCGQRTPDSITDAARKLGTAARKVGDAARNVIQAFQEGLGVTAKPAPKKAGARRKGAE